ncbi:solute carrier family 23 protein, partial [Streptococcus pneumoniae]|uniref:solute carrier family 23 protein n=1 Tax=Streptococcus pneumoniae TaxID=1313 RepID=UPI000A9D8021
GMPTFEISSIVMMCIIATVSMVESTGVYLALSDITKDPIDSTRLRNGYRAEGLAVLLGGIFNTFPYTGFSVMFGFVSIQGMQILARVDFANNEHNFLIAAVSIAAGVGLNNSNLF